MIELNTVSIGETYYDRKSVLNTVRKQNSLCERKITVDEPVTIMDIRGNDYVVSTVRGMEQWNCYRVQGLYRESMAMKRERHNARERNRKNRRIERHVRLNEKGAFLNC